MEEQGSHEELLAEQDVMELKRTKEAAARGVRLMGAVKAARLRAIAATARRRAATAATAAAAADYTVAPKEGDGADDFWPQ